MKLYGMLLITIALWGTEIWGKGRLKEDFVLTEATQFGEVKIAAGTIQVFADDKSFAHGHLANSQTVRGINFPAGAEVTISDYPPSMEIFEMTIQQTENIKVESLTLGNWVQFRMLDRHSSKVFTYLSGDGHAMGVDLKSGDYFSYACTYNDCGHIGRLETFTLKNDTYLLGVLVPGGTRVDTSIAFLELGLSRDIELQGLFISGKADRLTSINQIGRVVQFISSKAFDYRGVHIPAESFVRLDHDGNVKQVGNLLFP